MIERTLKETFMVEKVNRREKDGLDVKLISFSFFADFVKGHYSQFVFKIENIKFD